MCVVPWIVVLRIAWGVWLPWLVNAKIAEDAKRREEQHSISFFCCSSRAFAIFADFARTDDPAQTQGSPKRADHAAAQCLNRLTRRATICCCRDQGSASKPAAVKCSVTRVLVHAVQELRARSDTAKSHQQNLHLGEYQVGRDQLPPLLEPTAIRRNRRLRY